MSEELYTIINRIKKYTKNNNVAKISELILKLDNKNIPINIMLLTVSNTYDKILFFPSKNEDKLTSAISHDKKIKRNLEKFSEIKVGKLVSKLIEFYNDYYHGTEEFSNSDIENFVEEYKANFKMIYKIRKDIQIVEGEIIKDYYLEDNYSSDKGSLGVSCMKYDTCQPYFDFYIENNVKMAIMLDEDDKLLGRALIWELIDGNTFMDRIYTEKSEDEIIFQRYARENNMIYKERQNSSAKGLLYSPENKYSTSVFKKIQAKVQPIKKEVFINSSHPYFPYLDTLRYFYFEDGILSNNIIKEKIHYIVLQDSNGEFDCDGKCERNDKNEDCKYCGGVT